MVGCSLDGQADGDAICSDDWLVLWLSGLTAGVVAVSLVGWLVGELSAWMVRMVVEL